MGRAVGTLPTGLPVWAVTSLDNHLFVLRADQCSQKIEYYDIDSYHLLGCIRFHFHELGTVEDIVACKHNRCVYVSVRSNESAIIVISVTNIVMLVYVAVTIAGWPVDDEPSCLSLTATHGVLVTCCAVRKIKEFSRNGELLHEVTLPEDVLSVPHNPVVQRRVHCVPR